jgi:hypothetical protein
VIVAHGSLSRLASNAHPREQYFPEFLPVDRLRNGLWQQRHWSFAGFLLPTREAMTQAGEQNSWAFSRRLNGWLQFLQFLVTRFGSYRHLSLQNLAVFIPVNVTPQRPHTLSQYRPRLFAMFLHSLEQ